MRVHISVLRRSPVVFWPVVALVAVVTGVVVSNFVGRAARFGEVRAVVVATRRLTPGDVVSDRSAVVRRLPAAAVPPGALASIGGQTVRVPVFAGEPVLRGHVGAGVLPAGRVGMAVPVGNGVRVRRGDTVDVLATVDPQPTITLATGASVVDVNGETATVAVGLEDAKRIAFASAHGSVTVVLEAAFPS